MLKHPATPERFNQVVIEAGNSLYQEVIDRYVVKGEDVPRYLVQRAWRDTTQLLSWDAPIYAQLYETLREVNRGLLPEKRLRLVLADPPILWPRVRNREDYLPWLEQRDQFLAQKLEQAVRANKTSLVLYGSAHTLRLVDQRPNAFTQLEQQFPGSTFVVLPHVGFGFGFDQSQNEIYEPLVNSWPTKSLALLRETTLGAVPADLVVPSAMFGPGAPSNPYRGHALEELADAYLFLGPRARLTKSRPHAVTYRDDEYWWELNRRYALIHPQPLDPEGPEFDTDGRLIEPLPSFPMAPPGFPAPTSAPTP